MPHATTRGHTIAPPKTSGCRTRVRNPAGHRTAPPPSRPGCVEVLVLPSLGYLDACTTGHRLHDRVRHTPCCLPRSWKLCLRPCTVTGQSIPASTCASRQTSLSWSLPTGRVPASDPREQEPGLETWVVPLHQVAPVTADQFERPRFQRHRCPFRDPDQRVRTHNVQRGLGGRCWSYLAWLDVQAVL
jgi:hypothetical protein